MMQVYVWYKTNPPPLPPQKKRDNIPSTDQGNSIVVKLASSLVDLLLFFWLVLLFLVVGRRHGSRLDVVACQEFLKEDGGCGEDAMCEQKVVDKQGVCKSKECLAVKTERLHAPGAFSSARASTRPSIVPAVIWYCPFRRSLMRRGLPSLSVLSCCSCSSSGL